MILVYTTCKDREEAQRIGELVLRHRLAIAINSWPINAAYCTHDGGVQKVEAAALLIQTLETKLQDIEDLIERERPHATPFIGLIDVRRLNRSFKEKVSEFLR